MVDEETGQHNMQEMTFDLLTEIKEELSEIREEQANQRRQLEALTADVDTVHKLQQSLHERLTRVEQFVVGQPLRSTPAPQEDGRDGEGR